MAELLHPATGQEAAPAPVDGSAGLSYFADWPHVCALLWYPLHQTRCGTARCTACAPAMMASAQVAHCTVHATPRFCSKPLVSGILAF